MDIVAVESNNITNPDLGSSNKITKGKLKSKPVVYMPRKGNDNHPCAGIIAIWGLISVGLAIGGFILLAKGIGEKNIVNELGQVTSTSLVVKKVAFVAPGAILLSIGLITLLPLICIGKAFEKKH